MSKNLSASMSDGQKMRDAYASGDLTPTDALDAALFVLSLRAPSTTCDRVAMYLRESITFSELVNGPL